MQEQKNVQRSEDALEHVEFMYLITGHVPCEFPLDRKVMQDIFIDFLDDIDADTYGYPENNSVLTSDLKNDGQYHVDNEVFTLRPYYWGEDDDIINKPNFLFKPDNIEIRWYKYPLRSGTCSVNISEDKLREILGVCKDYVLNKKKGA